ncbi:MAG: alpha-ketoacid dehydrogenase subunit beta [Halobacteriota archaeon]
MSTEMTLVEAVRDGLHREMERDDDVVVLGEDVGDNGGVFRATEGLIDEYGADRVVDTPLSESGIVGASVGLAAAGVRPVAEIQFMGFAYPALDQIFSHVARMRTRTRGDYTLPLVVRMPYGGGIKAPEHHSESTEAFFAHYPGLKLVVPSTPYDARGMLASAIRSDDPVVVLEPKRVYRAFREEVPDESHEVAIGDARVVTEGDDVTVYTWGSMVHQVLDAAEDVDFDVCVVDLRTLSPLDRDTIEETFLRSGRACVVHEAPRTAGFGAEVVATVQERALGYQEAPVVRVTGFDVPYPLYRLEKYYLPSVERIRDGIRQAAEFRF